MKGTSIRFSPDTLSQLEVLACLESLRLGRRVSWASLVRGVVEEHLLKPNKEAVARAVEFHCEANGNR